MGSQLERPFRAVYGPGLSPAPICCPFISGASLGSQQRPPQHTSCLRLYRNPRSLSPASHTRRPHLWGHPGAWGTAGQPPPSPPAGSGPSTAEKSSGQLWPRLGWGAPTNPSEYPCMVLFSLQFYTPPRPARSSCFCFSPQVQTPSVSFPQVLLGPSLVLLSGGTVLYHPQSERLNSTALLPADPGRGAGPQAPPPIFCCKEMRAPGQVTPKMPAQGLQVVEEEMTHPGHTGGRLPRAGYGSAQIARRAGSQQRQGQRP